MNNEGSGDDPTVPSFPELLRQFAWSESRFAGEPVGKPVDTDLSRALTRAADDIEAQQRTVDEHRQLVAALRIVGGYLTARQINVAGTRQ